MLARIQAMRLMDDDFMTVVFDGDNEITEFLLRILLNRDDLRVKKVTTQKEKRNLFGRSVRLDILAEDDKGKLYNVEVQRADEGATPKRVRYNQAMLDSHCLKKKDDFNKLPELYIIFITENDYYGLGLPFYKIKRTVELSSTESMYLPFDDGCNIMENTVVMTRSRGTEKSQIFPRLLCFMSSPCFFYILSTLQSFFCKFRELGYGKLLWRVRFSRF